MEKIFKKINQKNIKEGKYYLFISDTFNCGCCCNTFEDWKIFKSLESLKKFVFGTLMKYVYDVHPKKSLKDLYYKKFRLDGDLDYSLLETAESLKDKDLSYKDILKFCYLIECTLNRNNRYLHLFLFDSYYSARSLLYTGSVCFETNEKLEDIYTCDNVDKYFKVQY